MEGYFSLPRVCNGILAGLVSITAPCSVVDTGDALAIGAIGAFVYYAASRFLERIQVDDPLDAWAVHGMCGAWGVISVGLFASSENVAFAGYNDTLVNATKGYRLSVQMFAVFIIIVWVTAFIGGLFFALRAFGLLRVNEEDERAGLDQADHGGIAVDYKRGYVVKDPKMRAQMTVFGRSNVAGSGSANSDQEEEENENGQNTDNDTIAPLQTGTSKHKKLRPEPTPHMKKYNPDPKESVDTDQKETEMAPVNSTFED